MKSGRLVAATVLLTAITLGSAPALKADASGAPYVISRTPIKVNSTCTLVVLEYSNGDWTFIETGTGCSKGPD